MDGLTSSESIDSPHVHIPIHTLYRCCLDTLNHISAIALHDESFKTYHARLKIWGAGLFTERPALDKILEEEPERYRPLLLSLQNTLFSIAVEEVVFLKSRNLFDGNSDIRLRLDPLTNTLLDLVSRSDTTVLACERRLPHLANTSTVGTPEPLNLQSSSSQDITPSGSNSRMTREDQSLKSQDARPEFINRLSKKLPAANEVISLFTNEDAVNHVQATSPGLGEHVLKEDSDGSIRQPSEVFHEEYDMYLGDFVESLFDLLPSVRGIRRTRLLETEFHQSSERSSSLDLVKQAVPQVARTLPESGVQLDKDSTGSRNTREQLQLPPYSNKLDSSGTTMSFGFSVSDIIISYQLAFRIYDRWFTKAQSADVNYLEFGRDINSLGSSLQRLELIIKNAKEQSLKTSWRHEANSTIATTLDTLLKITGDFRLTLHDCENLLSENSKFQRSAASFADNVIWHSSTERVVNHLRQRVNLHLTKLNFIIKPFELQLLLGIRRELQQAKNDVAALKGLLIPETARSIHTTSPKSHGGRFPVPPDVAKHFERALASKSDSVDVQDHLPLKEGFDALVFHLASSTGKFKPSPGPGQNIPEETQYINLLKSAWIMEKLKGSDYLQSAGSESLWADYTRELEKEISDQLFRFENGELEPPTLDVILGLSNDCFSIWVPEEPMPRPAVLPEQRPLEEKILELALEGLCESRRSTLTVFRKSDVAFRLVSTTEDERVKDFHGEESMDVNMNSDRFIPAFATSHDGEPMNNSVLLCNSPGKMLKWYHFQNSSAVAKFQRALTGYRVSHDMSNISWHIRAHKFDQTSVSGNARLQLWHLKPLKNALSSGDGTNLVRSGSSVGASSHSGDGTTLVGSGSSVRLGLQSPISNTLPLSGSTIAAAMTGSRKDSLGVTQPEPPVLVIFTKCERKYTIFHIRMDSSIYVKPLTQKKTCSRVLIESRSKEWNFRRLSAQLENERGLYSWDLACFRYPEHPAFQELEQLTKVKYIVLNFETVNKSEEFCKEFRLLENLRTCDMDDYNRTLRELRYKGNPWREDNVDEQ